MRGTRPGPVRANGRAQLPPRDGASASKLLCRQGRRVDWRLVIPGDVGPAQGDEGHEGRGLLSCGHEEGA